MKPIKEKAWAVKYKGDDSVCWDHAEGEWVGPKVFSTSEGARKWAKRIPVPQKPTAFPVLIIDPRHFDVVAKKKGEVKRGK